MSHKTWLILLALAGVLFGVSYLYFANKFCPVEQPALNLNWRLVPDLNENEKHDRAAYRYGRKKNDGHSVSTGFPPSYTLSQKTEAKKDAHHTESEGNVWLTKFACDAKLSDLLIALFTYGLFLATGWLVWATLKLWEAGERQIRVATEAANQATRSADIAERALIAGQRAFLFVTFNQSPVMDANTQKISAWNFTPVWNNTGDTPTRNMFNHISLRIFDTDLPMNWDFPDLWPDFIPEDRRGRVTVPCGARGTANGQTVGIGIDLFDEIVAETKFVYMWGWAAYNDAFPNTARHVTRFAIRILVGGNPRKRDRVTFTYIFLPDYNCSDEECDLQGFPADWQARQTTP